MAYNRRDDDMAYGDYHQQQEGQEGERGFIGDMGRRVFGGNKEVSALGLVGCRCCVLGASEGSLGLVGGSLHDASSFF